MAEWSKAPDSRLLPYSWIGSTHEREFWSSTEGMGSNPIPDNKFYTFLYVSGFLQKKACNFLDSKLNCIKPDLNFQSRCNFKGLQPYHVEYTSSRLITEVK